ncbi:hypothetical protein GTW69_38465 [Streptomyces sp. SID7760]|nr:hypothetical protein [Streptomyces sp. SID7760]
MAHFEFRDAWNNLVTVHPGSNGTEPTIELRRKDGRSIRITVARLEEAIAGIRDMARQAGGQTAPARDCPSCEVGAEHDVHCPTPETHNWACGCPTGQQPDEAQPGITVDDLARMLSAADVEINHGDYPTWDDLAESGEEQYRQAARYLLARTHITAAEGAGA